MLNDTPHPPVNNREIDDVDSDDVEEADDGGSVSVMRIFICFSRLIPNCLTFLTLTDLRILPIFVSSYHLRFA